MISRFAGVACLIVLGALSGGCSTLIKGDSQGMKFETDPPHAIVNVDGKDYTAPATVKLKRNQPHTVTVSAPGYQSITFGLQSQWDVTSLGDFAIPGGSVAYGVDTATGANKSFNDLAKITLKPGAGSSAQPMQMYNYRGKVLTKEEYDKAMAEDREYKTQVNP